MSASPAFSYDASPYPIRPDLTAAHRRVWDWLAAPGSWWTGAQRVAIAAQLRAARSCALCAERKAALSPFAIDGTHDTAGTTLPDTAVDAVHRLVTDASRLTRAWREKGQAAGLSDGHYVELLGVVVAVMSIDALHRALGLPVEPLPEPMPGDPTGYRPAQARDGEAWVPMLPRLRVKGPEADLYELGPILPNVLRAMTLVPDCVRILKLLSGAHYVPNVPDIRSNGGRALDRRQIELLAGRVSALNECFY